MFDLVVVVTVEVVRRKNNEVGDDGFLVHDGRGCDTQAIVLEESNNSSCRTSGNEFERVEVLV